MIMNKELDTARFNQKTTGLPMIIWICEKNDSYDVPIIIVQANHSKKVDKSNLVHVTIEDIPEVIEKGFSIADVSNVMSKGLSTADIPNVMGKGLSIDDLLILKKFIKLNLKSILQYWNLEIGADTFVEQLIRV